MTNDFMHVHVQVGREGTVLLDARRDFRSRSKLFGCRTAGLHITGVTGAESPTSPKTAMTLAEMPTTSFFLCASAMGE